MSNKKILILNKELININKKKNIVNLEKKEILRILNKFEKKYNSINKLNYKLNEKNKNFKREIIFLSKKINNLGLCHNVKINCKKYNFKNMGKILFKKFY